MADVEAFFKKRDAKRKRDSEKYSDSKNMAKRIAEDEARNKMVEEIAKIGIKEKKSHQHRSYKLLKEKQEMERQEAEKKKREERLKRVREKQEAEKKKREERLKRVRERHKQEQLEAKRLERELSKVKDKFYNLNFTKKFVDLLFDKCDIDEITDYLSQLNDNSDYGIIYPNLDDSEKWEYSDYHIINPLAKKYFAFDEPRPQQLEVISEIIEAIGKGYKYIVLEAGTGTGKSIIAATLTNIFNDAYILTGTKQLQNQYMHDFDNFSIVKGRGNFDCKSYLQNGRDYTTDFGKCKLEEYNCPYGRKDDDPLSKIPSCNYLKQKFIGVNSDVVVSNYHYAFYEFKVNNDFRERDLMIFDESHHIESNVMSLLTIEFKRQTLKEDINLNLKDYLSSLREGYEKWFVLVETIRGRYKHIIDKLEEKESKTTDDKKRISDYQTKVNEYEDFIYNLKEDYNNWVMHYDKRAQKLSFKPLHVNKFVEDAFLTKGGVCLFMSATILNYQKFIEWLGIDKEEVYAIRHKSPFDVKRNPMKVYKQFDLSNNLLRRNAPKTIHVIEEILKKHKNEKGIIHTVSYKCQKYIMNHIDNDRLICHYSSYDREQILKKFEDSDDPLVLVSPSMHEGVNLPGDKCRFQILYKLPYPALDTQIKRRREEEPIWYDYKTSVNLVQTYGRGMRSEDDYCKTYFMDNRLIKYLKNDEKHKFLIPDYIREAIEAGDDEEIFNKKY